MILTMPCLWALFSHSFVNPEDQKALRYFSDISDRRNQLMAEYAEKYGPLTIDSAAVSSENAWKWSQQPFPWEKEGA